MFMRKGRSSNRLIIFFWNLNKFYYLGVIKNILRKFYKVSFWDLKLSLVLVQNEQRKKCISNFFVKAKTYVFFKINFVNVYELKVKSIFDLDSLVLIQMQEFRFKYFSMFLTFWNQLKDFCFLEEYNQLAKAHSYAKTWTATDYESKTFLFFI